MMSAQTCPVGHRLMGGMTTGNNGLSTIWSLDLKRILVAVIKTVKRVDIQVGSQIKVGWLDDARRGELVESDNQTI